MFTSTGCSYVDEFALPWSYKVNEICLLCEATRCAGPMSFANPDLLAPWAATSRSFDDFLDIAIPAGTLSALSTIPGWHTHSLFEDLLHDDHLGLRLDGSGSVLKELCEEHFFGAAPAAGSWVRKLDVPLSTAWRQFKRWCRDRKISCSQPRFSRLNLSMQKMTDYPVLKAKGRNSVYLSEWLLECCTQSTAFVDSEHKRRRQTMMQGFVTLYNVPHDARPRVKLTEGEVSRLADARQQLLFCYHYLAHTCNAAGQRHYNIRPKYHRIDECVRRSCRTHVNPALFWTYGSESFMGVIARLSRQVHGGNTVRGTVERWGLYWWAELISLHARLHSSGWKKNREWVLLS